MFSKVKSLILGAAVCLTFVPTVQAEIFYIEDKDDLFSISFPDSWATITNQKPDDKLTIAGPGTNEHAICRVRVRSDRRFAIYPHKFDSDVQKLAYSHDFWKTYLGEYNDIEINAFRDEAGLGIGFASMAEASFETAEGSIVRKKGIMFASVHRNQMYAVDCSAEETVYNKWKPAFLSIVKSLDFTDKRQKTPQGSYRGFLSDEPTNVLGPTELENYKF